MSTNGKISRRSWLKTAAIFTTAAAAPAALSSTSLAEAKASKSVVHYQDHSKGMMQMCGMCKFFIPGGSNRGDLEMMEGSGTMMEAGMMGRGTGMMRAGMMGSGTCEVVAGRISPMGYCDLFASRG